MIAWATTALVVASLLALALASVRIVVGPTHADRIVALDIFLAAGVALAVAASLLTARTVFLDVAIGLALVGFVGTIGWARLVQKADPDDAQEDRP
ncbi:monovalent cation/H+ antiporter complex subunit F [Hydrogenophaga sp.]|uniref:monovalent cation/H+ antiporter complex subunit F n=1 Tax=Hydrogenophaga sp. TaxID=1904254 RepID=UPI0025C0ED2E|nr:monovalent cation/H+ antiporter complex subunit F [Hydrogenophaga sp.]